MWTSYFVSCRRTARGEILILLAHHTKYCRKSLFEHQNFDDE